MEETTDTQATIGESERWLSVLVGGLLLLSSLRRRPAPGALLALGGSALIHRGVTGHRGFLAALSDLVEAPGA